MSAAVIFLVEWYLGRGECGVIAKWRIVFPVARELDVDRHYCTLWFQRLRDVGFS